LLSVTGAATTGAATFGAAIIGGAIIGGAIIGRTNTAAMTAAPTPAKTSGCFIKTPMPPPKQAPISVTRIAVAAASMVAPAILSKAKPIAQRVEMTSSSRSEN